MDDTATWLLPAWVEHLNQKYNLLVNGCQKYRILITMPHNKDFDIEGAGIERADNWNDVRFLVHYNSILDRTNGSRYLQHR